MADLLLLQSFLAVAETGAITPAAARLFITQPALSRRLQQLETELGVKLFERSARGVRLTEEGRFLREAGKDLVERYAQLVTGVAHIRDLEAGNVRIGGGATAVSFLLPEAIKSFQGDFPGVLFQVKEAGSREIERDVAAERLELGVVTLPIDSALIGEFDVTPLFRDRVVLVASKSHPLASRAQLEPKDLDGQDLVGFESPSAIRTLIDEALVRAGAHVRVVMELRSIPAILRMVETTGRLAFVSQLGLPSGADSAVCELSLGGLEITRQLAIIRRRGRPLSPAAAAFRELLRENAASTASFTRPHGA